MASDVADSIDPDETIELVQDLVRIRSPYFEKEEAAAFVYDWLDERDLDPQFHHVSESNITEFQGENVIAGLEREEPLEHDGP